MYFESVKRSTSEFEKDLTSLEVKNEEGSWVRVVRNNAHYIVSTQMYRFPSLFTRSYIPDKVQNANIKFAVLNINLEEKKPQFSIIIQGS